MRPSYPQRVVILYHENRKFWKLGRFISLLGAIWYASHTGYFD